MLFTELLCAVAFFAELKIAGWRLIIKKPQPPYSS